MENPSTLGPTHAIIATALDPTSPGTVQATAVLNALRTGLPRIAFKEGMLSKDIEAILAKEIDAYAEHLKQHVAGRSLPTLLHDKLKTFGVLA